RTVEGSPAPSGGAGRTVAASRSDGGMTGAIRLGCTGVRMIWRRAGRKDPETAADLLYQVVREREEEVSGWRSPGVRNPGPDGSATFVVAVLHEPRSDPNGRTVKQRSHTVSIGNHNDDVQLARNH